MSKLVGEYYQLVVVEGFIQHKKRFVQENPHNYPESVIMRYIKYSREHLQINLRYLNLPDDKFQEVLEYYDDNVKPKGVPHG